MRFWSVMLLVATLLLLLYAATYFSVSHTIEQTTEMLIELSPDGREVERFDGLTSERVLRDGLQRAGANEGFADVAPYRRPVASADGK